MEKNVKNTTTDDDDVSLKFSYLAQAMVRAEDKITLDYMFLQLEYLEHCIRALERQSCRSAPTYLEFLRAYKTYDDGPSLNLARQERRRLVRFRSGAA